MTANYFDVLGVKPLYGRFFRPEEEAAGRSIPYVILSYSLWNTLFGGDPGIVGKPLEIAHHPVTAIGVAPEGFRRCGAGTAARYVDHARSARNGRLADDPAQRELAGRGGKAAAGREPRAGKPGS